MQVGSGRRTSVEQRAARDVLMKFLQDPQPGEEEFIALVRARTIKDAPMPNRSFAGDEEGAEVPLAPPHCPAPSCCQRWCMAPDMSKDRPQVYGQISPAQRPSSHASFHPH